MFTLLLSSEKAEMVHVEGVSSALGCQGGKVERIAELRTT